MLTQAQYELFTGQAVTFSEEDWQTLVSVASKRLASFLCLDTFPELTSDNQDLAMLLANFIAAVLRFQGNGDTVESKRVRNFTISFKTSSASNAFSQIVTQYSDVIDEYSQCNSGVVVERQEGCCCGRF